MENRRTILHADVDQCNENFIELILVLLQLSLRSMTRDIAENVYIAFIKS